MSSHRWMSRSLTCGSKFVKLSKIRLFFLTLVGFMPALRAFAFFDVELLYGTRWQVEESNGKKKGSAWQTKTAAAHISPIPLLPFSVGVAVSQLEIAKRDKSSLYSKVTGSELALDLMAWLPAIPFVTPYARIYLPVQAIYKINFKTLAGSMEANGGEGHIFYVGIKYPIFPFIKILLEGGKGVQMFKVEKCQILGNDCATNKNKSASSIETAMLGVEVGF